MKRAVFLDRDGVINRKPPEGKYVTRWEDMVILPGVPEAIALLTQAGYCVLAVSNQRCVAKGLLAARDLESIHKRLCRELEAKGAHITKIYYCPHDNNPPCNCRKPAPGLIFRAASENGIELKDSWMVGDSEVDIQAGQSAGCRTIRIGEKGSGAADAGLFARTLLEAARQVLELDL